MGKISSRLPGHVRILTYRTWPIGRSLTLTNSGSCRRSSFLHLVEITGTIILSYTFSLIDKINPSDYYMPLDSSLRTQVSKYCTVTGYPSG